MKEEKIKEKIRSLSLVTEEISKVIVGQKVVVEEILICILAGGHCLLEGVPGLAKTLMVNTLAKTLSLDFNRVQFTPDLMPSDIVGTEILEEDHTSGKRFFKFQHGPVFTNMLLADEINRTPPKTQAALLEAMQEKHVSYGGTNYSLPAPFFVLATQNPVEQSGTYRLPEAQLDRFLMLVKVDYPTENEEIEILQRTTSEQSIDLKTLLNEESVIELQKITRSIVISDDMLSYIARLVRNTRPSITSNQLVEQYVHWGAGPRAGQALVLCAKAKALLSGRLSVILEDIHSVVYAVLRHRVLINFQAEADGIAVEKVIESLLAQVPTPKSPLN